MKPLHSTLITILTLLAIATAATGGEPSSSYAMNGKLKITELKPEETRYTGKPYDKYLEAYVYAERTYDPSFGRWTTPDPRGFPESSNNFLYVKNRCLSFVDPDGATGKSIVWLYAYAGDDEDPSTDTDIGNIADTMKEQMITWDSSQTPSPRYLSDGDTFDYESITSASQIAQYANYNIIDLLIHGRPVLAPNEQSTNDQNLYGINGTIYTLSTLMGFQPFSSTLNIISCGTGVGFIEMGPTVEGMVGPTENYLYE